MTATTTHSGVFGDYAVETFYDEMFDPSGTPRPEYRTIFERIGQLGADELLARQRAADATLLNLGITFNLYGENATIERIFPFDIVPRVITAPDWSHIEEGLKQRIRALNLFLGDVYGPKHILNDGTIPRELVEGAPSYRKQCEGLEPPSGVWAHITGTDLVRDEQGHTFVLEDNLRCPSGVSYVVQNRLVMKRIYPQLFERMSIRPVDDYGSHLLQTLRGVAPVEPDEATVALLTPGMFNSAYYEHTFLAQQLGAELVEGRDLIVQDGYVWMHTTRGLSRVDVIYRRIDDDFLDPHAFRPDSLLGVPGLMDVYRAGNVTLANAPGTGIADDKVIYAFVPDMIRYYLDQEPILSNVPTYVCSRDDDRQYVLEHLADLVVKPANESGGYGILIGPKASKEQRRQFRRLIEQDPRNYIAQPTLSLSRVPVIVDRHMEGRHVDLRPFVLYGTDLYVLPGGLSRVALRKGSLVVNSSQGGGSKDTWVLSP